MVKYWLWMGRFWSRNASGKVGKSFGRKKTQKTAGCIDKIVACQKF
jgi:hypothetical protein